MEEQLKIDEKEMLSDERFKEIAKLVEYGLDGFTMSMKKLVKPEDHWIFMCLYLGNLLGCMIAAKEGETWKDTCINTVLDIAKQNADYVKLGFKENLLKNGQEN